MKNKILSIVGVFTLLTACEVQDLDNTQVVYVDLDSFGIVEDQEVDKIYVPVKYGTENDSVEFCEPPWLGECTAPESRTIDVFMGLSTCSSQLFKDEMMNACNNFRSFMTGVGWSVRCFGENDAPTPNVNLDLVCRSGGAAGVFGTTQLAQTPDNGWDCDDTSFGEFCKYDEATVIVFPTRIQSHAAWGSATDTKRRTFVRNVFKHELYHGAGLGHNRSAPGSQMMSPGAANETKPLSNFWNVNLAPNNIERDGLACYQPGSSTSPHPSVACPL